MIERRNTFLMPPAKNAGGKVRGALPRTPARGTPPETPAPFPLRAMFQNGPRRPGCATENLFKSGKDFPPPRTPRAPWTAAGRSEELPMRRERGQMQTQNQRECARPAASRWSASTCRGQANLPCCEPAGADKQFTEECLHKILDRSLVLRLAIQLDLKFPYLARCCQTHRQSPLLPSFTSTQK